jgi:hypothetical protein
MRVVRVGRATLAGLLAAVAVAGCTANPASPPVASGHSQTVTPRVASPASPPTPSPTPSPTPTATVTPVVLRATAPCRGAALPTAAPYGSSDVSNLIVSSDVRGTLLAAYAACHEIPPSDVAYEPGDAYYAYDPVTGRYWAMAGYESAPDAPLEVQLEVQVKLQDTADAGLFTKARTGPWQVEVGGDACSYLRFFPPPVLGAWGRLFFFTGNCDSERNSASPPSRS